jgi:hypothetical protein
MSGICLRLAYEYEYCRMLGICAAYVLLTTTWFVCQTYAMFNLYGSVWHLSRTWIDIAYVRLIPDLYLIPDVLSGLIFLCIYLPNAAQRNVLVEAACLVFCPLVKVFLLHQVLIILDNIIINIELFDINKLTRMI